MNPTRTPPPAPGSWLVFLCKASNAPGEPNTPDYYRALFDRNERDLMYDYFQTISGGALDVSGTEVYGWFRMGGVTRAQLAPAVRNVTTTPGRWQTLLDCTSTGVAALLAMGKTIEPDNYAGIIAVIHVPVDAGVVGKDVVANAFEPASFYGHEMLHAMTYPPGHLPHAHAMSEDVSADHSWNSGSDSEYGDCLDIMSYNVCIYSFDTPGHGKQGPELNIAYRQKLGWVDPARIAVIDNRNSAPTTVMLAPVTEPGLPGFLMAKIEMTGLGSYTVEYRIPGGFDRAIPFEAVVIRELRPNGETYVVKRQNGGAIGWVQGQRFTDAGSFVSINIDAITPRAATITVNPRFSAPANPGDRCGDKHLGVMRQCPAGTACNPRRVTPPRPDPVFFSTDYFCL